MATSGAASDYLEAIIMKWLGKNTQMPTPPATVYLALYIGGVPADDGSGATECSAGNYTRLALSTGTSGTGVGSTFTGPGATDGEISNLLDITFPMCSGADWGDVTGWALFDSVTGGNMLVRGDVSPIAPITVGTIFQFIAGAWLIKLD